MSAAADAPRPLRRALVTGGAGFIGSNLVDALLDAGAVVTVVDDLSSGRGANLDGARTRGATLHEADVLDAERLEAAFAASRPDVVFHLAAQISVRRSAEDPKGTMRANVDGTRAVLEAARRAGAYRVVNASTGGAIYGDADVIPTPETAPTRPLSPYGESKLAAESVLADYAGDRGPTSISLRFANVYGPRQDPLGEGGVVAIFCGRAAAGEPPTIYGDGEQTRDYVFVGDVVAALLAAARNSVGGAVNVGTGVETSVNDLLGALAAAGVRARSPIYEPVRGEEVRRSCLDVSLAGEVLDWRPRVALGDGMRATLDSLPGWT